MSVTMANLALADIVLAILEEVIYPMFPIRVDSRHANALLPSLCLTDNLIVDEYAKNPPSIQ